MTVIYVAPGADTLQAAYDSASDGDELVLADGTYTSTQSALLSITDGDDGNNFGYDTATWSYKAITIRAQNTGQAILDGEDTRGLIFADTVSNIALRGLGFTRG